MSLLPHSTSVFVVGPDPALREAIARLLNLDPELSVTGTAGSIDDPRSGSAAVVIDESLLREFKDLSVAGFIDMVKSLPSASTSATARHLVPVPGSASEMRELLSDRELQVVRLVAEGLSNKEISIRMSLSDKTVKNHISHILAKLRLTARTQVAVHALRAGIA